MLSTNPSVSITRLPSCIGKWHVGRIEVVAIAEKWIWRSLSHGKVLSSTFSSTLTTTSQPFCTTGFSRIYSSSTASVSSSSSQLQKDEKEVYHLDGKYRMIPKRLTVGKKIAVRSYLDRNRTELSERMYKPQKTWFMPYGIENNFLREKKRMTASTYSTTGTLQVFPKDELQDRPFAFHRHQLYNIETKLVWKAFDTPELIGMFLHDQCIHQSTLNPFSGIMKCRCRFSGTEEKREDHGIHALSLLSSDAGRPAPFRYHFDVYSESFLVKAYQYTLESRYWRCLGITKPFFDADTLRAHCWEDNGLQVGTLVFSHAMRHALMDLERAARRREIGLEPNYVWDRWGPMGFIDGTRMDYLPRFRHNPYRDPDGVEVTEQDILPYNTHKAIKERYGDFIFPDMEVFTGVFSASTNGGLSTLEDIPNVEAVNVFRRLRHGGEGSEGRTTSYLSPVELRVLLYLSAAFTAFQASTEAGPLSSWERASIQKWLSLATTATTWEEVESGMRPIMEEHDEKIDAARLLQNTRHHPDRVRAFFEEKCGFQDFMNTPDKIITGAVLAYLAELRRLCVETSWGAPLARALTDMERAKVMGYEAFLVYRHMEDAILDKKRKAWAARFSGEASEEHTLDYLLENFGRRVGSTSSASSSSTSANVGTMGEEFDREQEPIGRQVQRRVLDSDKANKLAEVRKSRGRMWSKKKTVFDSLHQKQLQNFNYGVR